MQHHASSSHYRRRHYHTSLVLFVLVVTPLIAIASLPAATALTTITTDNTATNSSISAITIDDTDSSDSDDPPSCSTRNDCCDLCGADSTRCARGPCSTAFLPKTLFSFSLPTTHISFSTVACAFYSMVPYLVLAGLLLELIGRRRLTWVRIFGIVLIPIVSVLTSSILVKSIGECADCSRPCGSCLKSVGMPSGHATNAAAYCIWIVLETLRGIGRYWRMRAQVPSLAGALLLFGPVAYSRMYLGDHTPLQVGIGSANGVVLGVLYFVVLRYIVAKRLDRASQWLARGRWPVVVRNDYVAKPATASASREVAPTHAVVLDHAYACGPLSPTQQSPSLQQSVLQAV